MAASPPPASLPVWATFLSSSIAASTAEICSLPIDTAKVRLQLQQGSGGALKYNGMLGTIGTIAREEGVAALWKGLTPGLHRQILFGGLRIGLYDPIKDFYMNSLGADVTAGVPLGVKILSGLTTGAVGISVASPTDLVKVRMQAQGRLPAGAPGTYPSAMSAYRIIAQQEGIAGLWTGIGPNIMRNSVINAAELASYDQIKEGLLSLPAFEDNVGTHILSGLGAGFVAVCVGSPVDVVKSRVMGDTQGLYKGVLDCAVKTATQDGVAAFYKGFIPNFGRLGLWNVIMFLTLEQVKAAFRERLN